MKRTIQIILVGILIITTIGCSQGNGNVKEEYNPDFRNVEWGMSKEEVKEKEDSTLFEETTDGLTYINLKIADLDAGVGYFFTGNKLNQIVVAFVDNNPNNYKIVQKNLIENYGSPDLENTMGQTSSFWKFEEDDLSIRLSMKESNSISIMYLKE